MAELVPFRSGDVSAIRDAIADLKDFQATHSLGGLSIRELIDEGRRR